MSIDLAPLVEPIIREARLRREYEPAALWILGEALMFHGIDIKAVGRMVRFHSVEDEDVVQCLIALRHENFLFDLHGNRDWHTLIEAQQIRHAKKWTRWTTEGDEQILLAMPTIVSTTIAPIKARCAEHVNFAVGLALSTQQADIIRDYTGPLGPENSLPRRL